MGLITSFVNPLLLDQPPSWQSGRYFGTDTHLHPEYSTGGSLSGNLYAFPIVVPAACSIDRIGAEVTTGSAGQNFRVGIALADGASRRPGTIILDSGNLSATNTGFIEATVSLSLPPGLVWGLITAGDATMRFRAVATNSRESVAGKSTGASSATIGTGYSMAHVFGALPASFSGSTTTNEHAVINVRVV